MYRAECIFCKPNSINCNGVQIISAADQCGYSLIEFNPLINSLAYPWKQFITNLSIILFEDSVSGQIIGYLNQRFAGSGYADWWLDVV